MSPRDDKATLAIREAAAEWIVRLADEGTPGPEHAEFLAWLRRSPEHVREYLQTETAWFAMEGIVHADSTNVPELLKSAPENVVPLAPASPLRREPADAQPVRSRLRRYWVGVAASAAAALLGAVILLAPSLFDRLDPNTYVTGVGEQRQILLADGSTVEMNTHSRIKVRMTAAARTVQLIEGEAYFDVAKDVSRPFEVLSDTAVVRAIGTRFNVYRRPEGTVVTVIEGRVAVAREAESDVEIAPVELAAGDRAQVSDRVAIRPVHTDAQNLIAWRDHRLIFENDTLADVIAEFNRYNPQQLYIDDPALAAERIDGVFDADKPRVLTRFLTRRGEVRATVMDNGRVLLSRSGQGARVR